jgi:hypothetical protein
MLMDPPSCSGSDALMHDGMRDAATSSGGHLIPEWVIR